MKEAVQRPATSRTGGLLPWMVWGLGASFYCYGFFQRVAPSVMVGELMSDFAVGAAITGILSALYFYAYAGLQIPIGLMLDRFGPRRLLAAAGVLSAIGSIFFALAPSLGPAYLGRALIGAGASVAWVGTLTLASQWFPPQRFALLTGLTMAMGMAGAVGGQAPLSAAVEAFGWRGTMWAAAAVAVLLTVAVWTVIRGEPPGHAHRAAEHAERGLLEGLQAVLTNPQTWLVALFGSMLTVPLLAFASLWGVPYMIQVHGLDRADAAVATSIMLVGWGIGAPLGGWFTDRIGRRKLPMLINAAIGLATITVALYVPGLPLPAIQALFLINGVFSGGMVLCFAVSREVNPVWASGAVLGVVNMAVMAGGAIFQPLIGWLLDLNWGGTMSDGSRVYSAEAFRVALLVLPAAQATSLLAALFVRETFCRQQP